jgi:hypothetical protein
MKRLGLMMTLVTLLAQPSWAKKVSASCTSDRGQSLEFQAELENANAPLKDIYLEVNGEEQVARDVSERPVYSKGELKIRVQFGQRFYSSVQMELSNCSDSFEASGKAQLKTYVGGFAGTSLSQLNCSCGLE